MSSTHAAGRDIPAEHVAALERAINAPKGARLSPQQIRSRQAYCLMRIIMSVDAALEEAFCAHMPAPGFIQVRLWCEDGLRELFDGLPHTPLPDDPVADAVAASAIAARAGNQEAYKAARKYEAEVRAKAAA